MTTVLAALDVDHVHGFFDLLMLAQHSVRIIAIVGMPHYLNVPNLVAILQPHSHNAPKI